MAPAIPICILALAGFTQGLTGFGFGLVSMALLPLVLPFKEALVVVAVLNVPVCALTLFSNWRHFHWRRGATLALGSCVGVPLGFYLLVRLDGHLLLRILGALLCLFAVNELFLARRFPLRFPGWSGFPVGLLSGSIGGAFNVGGPPVIAYVYAQSWTKEEIVAVLQLVFGTSALLRLAFVGHSGLLQPDLVRLTLLALVPLLGGILLGGRLLHRVPLPPLKFTVFLSLLGLGAKYVVAP
jgi:hypothetical protein